MKFFSTLLLSVVYCAIGCPRRAPQSPVYLAQTPPGEKPEIFAAGVVSRPDEYEFGSVFSRDGQEFFYGVDLGQRSEIRLVVLNKKSQPITRTIVSHEMYSFNDPFLSPNDNELFYISDRPLDGRGAKKDFDIWYSKRTSNGWSAPIHAGSLLNSDRDEYYISLTKHGSLFFASNINAEAGKDDFDIYKARRTNGRFQTPVRLGEAVNTKQYEADVFVAPDESYLIFCAKRRNGLGQGDLFISFKRDDGTWTEAENMGENVNSEGHELCPFVTADGKYFFFTSNMDIYWVDAGIIAQYR